YEKKTMMEEFSKEDDVGSQTHIVKIPVETSSPGCEETNACYLPTSITINVGDTIKWINLDIATHTASSGSLSEGPTSVFESSLIRNNASFTFTFEETGIYDYYCMLHPWMIGSVSVS
ncbi:MAG: plastocyanin/azurin family copper-binding protein, partial [Nitrosopumilus sp.]|nr:plastocyanin/azurin family copper-binding protein [Nitrosopumilus sp.]